VSNGGLCALCEQGVVAGECVREGPGVATETMWVWGGLMSARHEESSYSTAEGGKVWLMWCIG